MCSYTRRLVPANIAQALAGTSPREMLVHCVPPRFAVSQAFTLLLLPHHSSSVEQIVLRLPRVSFLGMLRPLHFENEVISDSDMSSYCLDGVRRGLLGCVKYVAKSARLCPTAVCPVARRHILFGPVVAQDHFILSHCR